MTIQIIKATNLGEHHIGNEESECFYFDPVILPRIAMQKRDLYGRFARIEVKDKITPLHAHPGATFVVITAGCGIFMTEDGEYPVSPGDMVYVSPKTLHLSVALPHTTMIEHIVYIGAANDRQSIV